MTKRLHIATAQLNFKVGDLASNREKIAKAHVRANDEGADLVIFSEMAITGYPPEDLVLRTSFQEQATDIIRQLAPLTKNATAILVGGLWRECEGHIYNAAILLDNGKIEHIICKHHLPNYGVFDEKRVFKAAPRPEPIEFRGTKLGVMICEDTWRIGTCKHLKSLGAEILISINASPFEHEKHEQRMDIALKNVQKTSLPLIYVNQVGGQDEIVFEGGSFALSYAGEIQLKQPLWQENLAFTKWEKTKKGWVCINETIKYNEPQRLELIYNAVKLGLHDYVQKNGFTGVIIGMSGGIDSALTAAIAVDALGADRVRPIMMPSKYTSQESKIDAKQCSDLLGASLEEINISEAVDAFDSMLSEIFKGTKQGLAEENIQSRTRGNILMAISNKFGHMVLTTGNKSEMAVGYATLYGDMCGGFNALKDIYKTDVFELCRWRNSQSHVIPDNIIAKPPTAELRDNQKDSDSLPDYEILDDILNRLIELRHSTTQIAQHGYELSLVEKIAKLVKIAEYKRRQSPPGVKITQLAFGKDRRYPITSGFDF